MLRPLHQIEHFFEGLTPSLSKMKFPSADKIADFQHNKHFFLIAPRDLHYFWHMGSMFSAPDHAQHIFSLCVCPKMVVFP